MRPLTSLDGEVQKFGPGHFPVGTIFKFNEEWLRLGRPEGDDGIRTVQYLAKNGCDSYVIYTGRERPFVDGSTTSEVGNLQFVEAIISRGDGPMKIDYGIERWLPTTFKDVQNGSIRLPVVLHGETKIKPRRNHYVNGFLDSVLRYEIQRLGRHEVAIDYPKMHDAVKAQSWYHKVQLSERFTGLRAHVMSRKRLRKFIKANFNRWIIPMKTLLAEEARAQQEENDRYFAEQAAEWERKNMHEDDYYEGTNEFGYLQMMMRDTGGDTPVCSQCHSAVMPNRGQGMLCDKCGSDFDKECEHDYRDSRGSVFATDTEPELNDSPFDD